MGIFNFVLYYRPALTVRHIFLPYAKYGKKKKETEHNATDDIEIVLLTWMHKLFIISIKLQNISEKDLSMSIEY